MKLIKEYGTTVAIVMVGLLAIIWMLNPQPHPMIGAEAPTFALNTPGGETIDLAQHLGKDVILLDFWASWCPPCRKGLPVVDTVAKHFAGESVVVYGVNVMERPELVSSFSTSQKLDLTMLVDATGAVSDDYGVTGIPQTVIIGKDGTIHTIHVGIGMNFEAELKADIQGLLDGVIAAN